MRMGILDTQLIMKERETLLAQVVCAGGHFERKIKAEFYEHS